MRFLHQLTRLRQGRRPRPNFRPRLEALECRLAPAVFTVSNTSDSGAGSLRQAILNANATPGSSTIDFSIGSGQQVIVPASPLPALTNPVTIDGTTQPGFSGTPLIQLSGFNAGASADGLFLRGGSSTVKGLIVNFFGGSGIALAINGGDVISGDWVGLKGTGGNSSPNGFAGVADLGAGGSQIINDVISGNGTFGVYIDGASSDVVAGNLVGTNAADSAAVPNGYAGVDLAFHASGNIVANNILSGNLGFGLLLTDSTTSDNAVLANDIGLSGSGAALPNTFGVVIANGASGNTVGGSSASLRNNISGNSADGVVLSGAGTSGNTVQGNYIGTNPAGTAAAANGQNDLVIQDGASGNVIGGDLISAAGIGWNGVLIFGAGTDGNAIGSSFFGTTAGGTAGLANFESIDIVGGASGNVVANNVVGANTNTAIVISDAGTTGNVVEANFLGTNPAGSITYSNSGSDGVVIEDGAAGNTIGGSTRALGNVIANQGDVGIDLDGTGVSGNVVENNLIGTNPAGTAAMANHIGVFVFTGASGNLIANNVISGNGEGLELDTGATGNLVVGNFIGTNAAGTAGVPNTTDGVTIEGSGNIIGGTTAAVRNVISDNNTYGILIDGNNNLVVGNFIGTKADGVTALGNVFAGVFVESGGSGNTIGGTAAGDGNVIAFNTGDGVLIGSDPGNGFTVAAGTGNTVEGNSIFGNAKIGIDLGPDDGVTANGFNGNVGPNNFENYPVLTAAMVSGNSLVVTGTFTAPPSATDSVRLEFFANPVADPSGHGQGQTFLGFTNVYVENLTTTFVAVLADPNASGQVISATATDTNGNTSEFSADVTAH